MGYSTANYPEKGTAEYHVKTLKKLQKWLSNNPHNSPLVADEADAVAWALTQVEPEAKAE